MSSTQSEVKALLDSWSGAIRAKDIDRLMSLYSPDIVYFDLVPPLRYAGSAAIRRNFLRWFDSWKSSIGAEIRDLHIAASGQTAVAFMLHRTSGTLKDGREVRILGTRDRLLPAIRSGVVDNPRTYLAAG